MAKKFTKFGQRVFRPLIKSGLHKGKPKCIIDDCNNPGQYTGVKRLDGTKVYRPKCHKHHCIQYGLDVYAYRQYKKDYCENKDGRLGFICTANIVDSCQLDLDHANNNHDDNRKINCDTLCSSCHNYKTKYFSKYKGLATIRKIYAKNVRKTKQKRKKSV